MRRRPCVTPIAAFPPTLASPPTLSLPREGQGGGAARASSTTAVATAAATAIATTIAAAPAHAHSGEHGHMSLLELARHFAEPDHLAFLAATVLVGWLAFRWGRRIEARAQARQRQAATQQERERP